MIVSAVAAVVSAWIPVSYTHLDVYKRQILNDVTGDLWKYGVLDDVKNLAFNASSIPVSYTHLDVYKRQGGDSVL